MHRYSRFFVSGQNHFFNFFKVYKLRGIIIQVMPLTLHTVFCSPIIELTVLGPALANSQICSSGLCSEVMAPKQSPVSTRQGSFLCVCNSKHTVSEITKYLHMYTKSKFCTPCTFNKAVYLKPSKAKVLTGGGDLREAQVDVPLSVSHSCV